MARVKVFGKQDCVFCDKAKTLLDNRNVPYDYIDVELDIEGRNALLDMGLRSVPQIFRDGIHIPGGYQGIAGMSPDTFSKTFSHSE